MSHEKKIWDAALQRTSECVAPERFTAGLTNSEIIHVAGCPRCQAEYALWRSFEEPPAAAEEGAAVQWITTELKRRSQPKPAVRWWRRLDGGSWVVRAAAAGVCTILIAVGITLNMRRANSDQPVFDPGAPVYRSTALAVIAPVGEQAVAPSVLKWSPHATARQYRVRVMEVDRTVLWSTTVSADSVRLPAPVRAAALPGKTLLWQVEALASSGEVLTSSPVERFRVRTKQIPDGQ